jgi:S1-C subfamily serine protease
VDALDFLVIAVAIAAAVGGYRLGFLGRVISWIGLALGFYVAIRVLPSVIVHMASSAPGLQVFVAILLLVGGALVGQAAGLLIGFRLHRALPPGPVREVDRVVGAGVGALGVLTVLWLLLPSIAAVPGWPARAANGSAISRWVDAHLPSPPATLSTLRRMIASGAPEVFSGLGGTTATGPVPTVSPLAQAVTNAVVASTVKVQGQACGRIYEGSGFAVAPSLVVTNAHVVAGEHAGNTAVLLPSGRVAAATVVMFDPRRDIALLSVPGLGESPLALATPQAGEVGAAFGHPNGQDAIAITPARVSRAITATGADIYDNGSTVRQVLILAATLAHGDSGGPLVNPAGAVIGVDFAISATNPSTSYALNTSELRSALTEPRNGSGASTGSCLTS